MYKYGKKLILNESESLISHRDLICALELVSSHVPVPELLNESIEKYKKVKAYFNQDKFSDDEIKKDKYKKLLHKNKVDLRGCKDDEKCKGFIEEIKMVLPEPICKISGYQLCCEAHQCHIGIAPSKRWHGELLPSDYESLGREIRNLEQKLYVKGWPYSALITIIYGMARRGHEYNIQSNRNLWDDLEEREKNLIVRTYGGLFIAETTRDIKNWIYLSLLCNFGKGGIIYGNNKEIKLSTIVWGKENLEDRKSSYEDVKAQKSKLKLYTHRENVKLRNGMDGETAGWASLGGKNPLTAAGGNDKSLVNKPGSINTAKVYDLLLNFISNRHNDIYRVERINGIKEVFYISQHSAIKKNVISLITFFEDLFKIKVNKEDKVINKAIERVNAFPALDDPRLEVDRAFKQLEDLNKIEELEELEELNKIEELEEYKNLNKVD
ncbi:hypothetical protein [Vibrio sp. RE88]|uniref:hypothetical protein n=1 Tax=Vibrio sp. RE88 TaxID=2607610 RepID=UPI001493C292|nr:hypothetical protein [Vibrio sp. RE88]NOH61132.1 hypothetical protein [Vibrio sp. RE88]